MSAQLQDSDITEAAAEYLWSVCGQGRLAPLAVVRRQDFDDAVNGALVDGVRHKLSTFRQGDRLTDHRSGDGYEALREPYRQLLRDLLDKWQRGETSGGTARLMTGSVSYGALYGLARDLGVEIRAMPRDIAARVVSGDLTAEEARDILGIEDFELGAFLEAWTL
ncbi:hypothetical protein [Rhizobium sp. Leaf383]|uniref:hypothetical protein n=1 Tax=Rhizobium sp. Leaf383 TaxID=1736357 RepID=UPI0007132688|nr:hypothetical protein [Rhizobium sp. Leaf383]KQS84851.1 hypothetical protein ASG58_20375 [Rhizobium sp. Leaf383]